MKSARFAQGIQTSRQTRPILRDLENEATIRSLTALSSNDHASQHPPLKPDQVLAMQRHLGNRVTSNAVQQIQRAKRYHTTHSGTKEADDQPRSSRQGRGPSRRQTIDTESDSESSFDPRSRRRTIDTESSSDSSTASFHPSDYASSSSSSAGDVADRDRQIEQIRGSIKKRFGPMIKKAKEVLQKIEGGEDNATVEETGQIAGYLDEVAIVVEGWTQGLLGKLPLVGNLVSVAAAAMEVYTALKRRRALQRIVAYGAEEDSSSSSSSYSYSYSDSYSNSYSYSDSDSYDSDSTTSSSAGFDSGDVAEIRSSATHGLAKVTRRIWEAAAKLSGTIVKAVSRLITFFTGGSLAIVTEPVAIVVDLVKVLRRAFGAAKAAFKFARGTLGKGRTDSATTFVESAENGNMAAAKIVIDLAPFGKAQKELLKRGAGDYAAFGDPERAQLAKVFDSESPRELRDALRNLSSSEQRKLVIKRVADTLKST